VRQIDIEIHELEAEYNHLHAKEIAFLADDFRFRPPAPEVVEQIKQMVRDLDRLLAQTTRAARIIGDVTNLLNTWQRATA
jgi:hypothetical protein